MVTNPYPVVVDIMGITHAVEIDQLDYNYPDSHVRVLCGVILSPGSILYIDRVSTIDSAEGGAVCQECRGRLRHINSSDSVLAIYRTHINRRAEYIDKCQVLHHELEQMDLAAIQEIVNASTLTPTPSVSIVKG